MGKGVTFQKKVAREYFHKTGKSVNVGPHGVDVGSSYFAIECKNQKKVDIRAALNQSHTLASASQWPVVIAKEEGHDPIVFMDQKTFFDIVLAVEELYGELRTKQRAVSTGGGSNNSIHSTGVQDTNIKNG